jgi:hypothetical protein
VVDSSTNHILHYHLAAGNQFSVTDIKFSGLTLTQITRSTVHAKNRPAVVPDCICHTASGKISSVVSLSQVSVLSGSKVIITAHDKCACESNVLLTCLVFGVFCCRFFAVRRNSEPM